MQKTLIQIIDHVEDKRIHATMYPVNATNLYKACLAGVRRQKYWDDCFLSRKEENH